MICRHAEFGNAIRDARLERGWNISEAARRLSRTGRRSISQKYLALLESGRHTPLYSKTVLDLSTLYDLPEEHLYRLLQWKTGPSFSFGEVIRDARLIRGWTLVDVSKQIKGKSNASISKSFLHQMERGQRIPQSDRIVHDLANLFNLSPDWFLYLIGRFSVDIRRKNIPSDTLQAVLDKLRAS